MAVRCPITLFAIVLPYPSLRGVQSVLSHAAAVVVTSIFTASRTFEVRYRRPWDKIQNNLTPVF